MFAKKLLIFITLFFGPLHACLEINSPNKNLNFVWAHSCRQGKRNEMEDTHAIHILKNKNQAIFILNDGHGGKKAAEYVENNFLQFFLAKKDSEQD